MKRIVITEERLRQIISEVVANLADKSIEDRIEHDGQRLLKHVVAKDTHHLRPRDHDIWITMGKDGYVRVNWKSVKTPWSLTCGEWMKPVGTSGRFYSTVANWPEMEWALKCLGIEKVKETHQKVDDFGEIDTYTTSYYDLSSIL